MLPRCFLWIESPHINILYCSFIFCQSHPNCCRYRMLITVTVSPVKGMISISLECPLLFVNMRPVQLCLSIKRPPTRFLNIVTLEDCNDDNYNSGYGNICCYNSVIIINNNNIPVAWRWRGEFHVASATAYCKVIIITENRFLGNAHYVSQTDITVAAENSAK